MPEEIVRVNEANQKSDRLEKQVATPADFTSPEVLYEDLIQEIRKYHPSSDLSDIERAYKIARDAHEGQKRKSGEPYIIRCAWQLSLQSWNLIKKQLLRDFCMTW
jgi:guanosine-3',5'-bis(diphosphate) 3'-pyrophosphohydrolase